MWARTLALSLACALVPALASGSAGAQAPDPVEPEPVPFEDVEPDQPVDPDDVEPDSPDYDDDVEPDSPLFDDVEPDVEPADPATGPDATLDEAEQKRKARRAELPADGEADRPAMPRVGIDLIYPGQGMVGQGGAALAFSQVGEDMFLTLNLSTVFVFEDFAIAPRLPLRLRVVDNKPHTKEVVREQDWDEVSDFARLLAFFQYGHVGDPFFLRFGELAGATIGHGSFVNRYYNTADIDHYQGGVFVYGDASLVGAELLVDNVLSPEVALARAFVRPLDWLGGLPWILRKLKFGVTGGADFRAPAKLGTVNGDIQTDDTNSPVVLSEEPLPMVGTDLEVPVVSTPYFDLVPYLDLNLLDGDALGVHAGTYITVRFDPMTEWRTRVEYRYALPGYDPSYVNPFYEIQRLRMNAEQTKLEWLRGPATAEPRHGFYIESEFHMIGTMRYAVVFAEAEGPDNTDLVMRLQFPKLGPVSLSFFFARLEFDGLEDFFDPHNTVFAVTGRYNIMELFYVQLRVINEWWLRPTESGGGTFETTTDFDVGFGVLLDF